MNQEKNVFLMVFLIIVFVASGKLIGGKTSYSLHQNYTGKCEQYFL
jgi:hypothetical protein